MEKFVGAVKVNLREGGGGVAVYESLDGGEDLGGEIGGVNLQHNTTLFRKNTF